MRRSICNQRRESRDSTNPVATFDTTDRFLARIASGPYELCVNFADRFEGTEIPNRRNPLVQLINAIYPSNLERRLRFSGPALNAGLIEICSAADDPNDHSSFRSSPFRDIQQ